MIFFPVYNLQDAIFEIYRHTFDSHLFDLKQFIYPKYQALC